MMLSASEQVCINYFPQNCAISRVVHSSHSWAIFGSFSCIWQRNKQKGMKNHVKNG